MTICTHYDVVDIHDQKPNYQVNENHFNKTEIHRDSRLQEEDIIAFLWCPWVGGVAERDVDG